MISKFKGKQLFLTIALLAMTATRSISQPSEGGHKDDPIEARGLSASFVKDITTLNVAVASQKRKFDSSKTSIGGLKLDMNINKVRKILGAPLQQKQKILTDDDGVCGNSGSYLVKLKYSKTEVSLLGKTPNSAVPYNITTSNPSFATSEGIRVGDSIVKAKKAYAKYESSQNGDELIYGMISTLSFKANSGRITQISLNYDSCD
jgi:hypothetical protein